MKNQRLFFSLVVRRILPDTSVTYWGLLTSLYGCLKVIGHGTLDISRAAIVHSATDLEPATHMVSVEMFVLGDDPEAVAVRGHTHIVPKIIHDLSPLACGWDISLAYLDVRTAA